MKQIYLLLLLMILPLVAQGQVAIGGESPNSNSVYWLSWHQSQLESHPDGFEENLLRGEYVWMFTDEVRITATIEFDDEKDEVEIRNYTPGQWYFDGLRHLYNGEPQEDLAEPNGIPYSGLANVVKGNTTQPFNIGVNLEFYIEGAWRDIDYPGMVIADAEELDGKGEYIEAETNAAGWQLIDKYEYPNGNANNYQLIFNGDDQLRIQARDTGTYSQAVLFAKEATQLRNVKMYGTGHSALALGFVLPFDVSEGPYCEARHYIDDFDYTAPDFGGKEETYVLGGLTESELNALPTVYIGSPDDPLDNNSIPEEQLQINFVQRQIEITVNVVNLKEENATLYWWMDFNGDGVYSPDEMKFFPIPNIASGETAEEVTLVFPEKDFPEEYKGIRHLRVGDLHSRLRITTTELSDHENTPNDERACGLAMDGEVEDYIFDVRGISISGEVFIDADGMTDDAVDGSFMGDNLVFGKQFTGPLYAYLLREDDQYIAGKTTITADGSYTITDMNHGYYTLVLSHHDYTIETTFPSGPVDHLPLDWVVMGETLGINNASVVENLLDDVIDGQVPIETPTAGYDLTEVNFGINQPPEVVDLSYTIEAYGKVEAPVLTHAVDYQGNCSIVEESLVLIDSDGVAQTTIVMDGIGTFSVTEGNEISFVPFRNFHGNSVSVPYAVADAATLVSEPGLLTIEVEQPQFIMVNPVLPSRVGG